jgi:hypothetical protein
MISEEMQTLLSKPNNAIVGVNRADGGPQLTPVWFEWDGTSLYSKLVTSPLDTGPEQGYTCSLQLLNAEGESLGSPHGSTD